MNDDGDWRVDSAGTASPGIGPGSTDSTSGAGTEWIIVLEQQVEFIYIRRLQTQAQEWEVYTWMFTMEAGVYIVRIGNNKHEVRQQWIKL